MRPRLSYQVVVVTLLATALAGCSSAPAPTEDPDDALKYGYVDANNKTHGLVAGIVLTVAGEPLPDALVTILSVDGSVTSDSTGKFQFTGVVKGEQTLRVEKVGHKTLQRPFTVVAGKIVELEVVLARTDGLRGGAIEHFHDHWRGQEVYTVYEGRIEWDSDVTKGPTASNRGFQYHRLVLDEDRIVPPGTVMISIDISVEPSPDGMEYWEFYVFPPPGPGGTLFDEDWNVGSGDTHLEYTLASPEITDHGHATSTSWEFVLASSNFVGGLVWSQAYHLLFPNPVDVTITAHKGDLVIDPPHPRYWADTDRIEMPTGSETYVDCAVPGAVAYGCGDRSPNPDVRFGGPYASIRNDATRRCEQSGCLILDRDGLVPPGTTGISFDLEMWQGAAPTGTEPPLLEDTDWALGFKTAAPPQGQATWDDYTWIEPVETFEPEPQQDRYHQQGLRYRIDVPAGGEDAYYTVYSGWVFMMAVQGHETASDYSDMSCSTDLCGSSGFELKNFFVHNDSSTAMDMDSA